MMQRLTFTMSQVQESASVLYEHSIHIHPFHWDIVPTVDIRRAIDRDVDEVTVDRLFMFV